MTHSDLEYVFWAFVGTLHEDSQLVLKYYWAKRGGIEIVSDPAQIAAVEAVENAVTWSGTDGRRFFFKLDAIRRDGHNLVAIIFHEVGHALLFAIGRYSQDGLNGREDLRLAFERDAERCEALWLRALKANRALCEKLMADSLIRKYASEFHFESALLGDQPLLEDTRPPPVI